MIELVGFDGDDTLWHSEGYYQTVHDQFERLVGAYVDLADARLHERLLETEQRNIRLFGYGAKGMTVSMIETAIEITDARISATDVEELLRLGKDSLRSDIEPVVALGGWGVYVPYHITWAHEMETSLAREHPRYVDVAGPGEIPAALSVLQARKG